MASTIMVKAGPASTASAIKVAYSMKSDRQYCPQSHFLVENTI
jgi:hypothetical protein